MDYIWNDLFNNNVLNCKTFKWNKYENNLRVDFTHSKRFFTRITLYNVAYEDFCVFSYNMQYLIRKMLTCVSVSISEVATSNLFGLLRYLFCLNCFSNSSNCCDVKAVLGLLVFPRRACWAAQPIDNNYTFNCYYSFNATFNKNIYINSTVRFICLKKRKKDRRKSVYPLLVIDTTLVWININRSQ